MRTTAWLLPLVLVGLPFLACSSNKNGAERAEAAAMDPSNAPIDYNDEAAMKAACIGDCKPDPGSKSVDVAGAEAGYQFAWLWNLVPAAAGGDGKAWATYTYDDNTSPFVVPIRTVSKLAPALGGWEPFSDPVPAGQGPAWAVRFKGGPFTEYGGGFGQSFRTITNTDQRNPLLAATPSAEFPDATGGAYDLSSWQGIAIWVRRGPDGQSTMRVGITERNSAEDLNSGAMNVNAPVTGVQEGHYCKRWRICGCAGGTPCTADGTTGKERCFDPDYGPITAEMRADPYFEFNYPVCGSTRCDAFNTSSEGADPLFNGKSCSAAVQADGRSDRFCYDPGKDPNPPAKRERCNNPFSRSFTVTTDWQLIKVPFTELRQADEAKVADEMDLKSVKQLVVTYSGGWVDFWVANVGFYRKQ
jgi:hypothetical protein